MGRRILNEALGKIVNAEKRGFTSTQLQPVSNLMASFLNIMKYRGYIKDFQVHDPHRVGSITVELQGRINDCRAIMYRLDIKAQDIEKYRVRVLPTHQMCVQWFWKDRAACFREACCFWCFSSYSIRFKGLFGG